MMIVYSGITCPFSQRCRIVLYEKGMDFEIKDVDIFNKPEDLVLMNPYNQVPVLVERDLTLHESNIINEYIDERFPHPQLMPADPITRGRGRLFMYRLEKEIFSQVQILESINLESGEGKKKYNIKEKEQDAARQNIAEGLTLLSPMFAKNKYILGDDFSLLDVALAPLLWRLDYYDINLGESCAAILKYRERIFQRESFIEALTPAEKAMRK
ncbi:stringent starvation protein A [Neisseriaceae bacterium PsAf]|nr:stringent starvation protein A [Neisseriaceae bacterium PsAf]